MEKWYLVLCRVNLILDKSGFKVLGKAFLSDFWFWFLVFWFWHFLSFESFHSSSMCLFFGFSSLPSSDTCQMSFLCSIRCHPFSFFLVVSSQSFWLSTLPSNSSVRVGLSFSIWKGINVHSQSSSVEATSPRCVGQFFGLNSPPLSCSLLIPVLFCSFLCVFGIKRRNEREREHKREMEGVRDGFG